MWNSLDMGTNHFPPLDRHHPKIGVIACSNNCWMNRSNTVGIPSPRLPPSGLGISTRRTGLGTYRPASSFARSCGQCAARWSGSCPTSMRSMPLAPRLRLTAASARPQFSPATTSAIRFSCIACGRKVRKVSASPPPLWPRHGCTASGLGAHGVATVVVTPGVLGSPGFRFSAFSSSAP